MKILPHAFAKLFAQPVLLHAPFRGVLEHQLLSHMGITVGKMDFSNPTPAPAPTAALPYRVDRIYDTVGNIAIIQIHGVIDKMISEFEMECYGGCDLADIDQALALAGADPAIDTIVLDIHSPGGSVTGTPETAARIAALRDTHEIHAYTSTMCCSAAYYIASQADHIATAPSATVGSIGVYMAILDQTRALEMEGYKVELIKAGQFKAMGASFKPLTDDERDLLQSRVDAIHSDFKAAVTTLRDVKDTTMQGQSFDGTEAESLGLIDEITGANLDEYISGLLLR